MKVDINRPEQCPYMTPAYCYMDLCGHPGAPRVMYCDTSISAVGDDGFPANCPLRENEQSQKEDNNAI